MRVVEVRRQQGWVGPFVMWQVYRGECGCPWMCLLGCLGHSSWVLMKLVCSRVWRWRSVGFHKELSRFCTTPSFAEQSRVHQWDTVDFTVTSTRFATWKGALRWNHLMLRTSKGLVIRKVRLISRWGALNVYIFLMKLCSVLCGHSLNSSYAMFIEQSSWLIKKLVFNVFSLRMSRTGGR